MSIKQLHHRIQIKFVIPMVLVSLVSSCTHLQKQTEQPIQSNVSPNTQSAILPEAQRHIALKNYISYDLDYAPYKIQREQLEAELQNQKHPIAKDLPLKNRGEAHITVITPPEFDILSKKISAELIHSTANDFFKQKPEFQQICIGEGRLQQNSKNLWTYFIVVKSPTLIELRKKLAQLAKVTNQEFNPLEFYPHITLGFNSRDLHLQDGVVKNENSCLKK